MLFSNLSIYIIMFSPLLNYSTLWKPPVGSWDLLIDLEQYLVTFRADCSHDTILSIMNIHHNSSLYLAYLFQGENS